MLLWADGFGWIESASGLTNLQQLQTRYFNVTSAGSLTTGELGQPCLLGQASFTTPRLVTIPVDEYVIGFSMMAQVATQAALNGPLLGLVNGLGTLLRLDCLATPSLERGDFKLVLIDSASNFIGSIGPFYVNSWSYIEIRVFGTSLQVRVSGMLVLDVELQSAAPIDRVRLSPLGQMACDSFYVIDSSGALNNDFLGPVSVDCLFPVLEFNSSGWVGVPGSPVFALRWVDGDSSYIDGSAGGSIRFRMDPAFRSSAGSIAGLFISYSGSGVPIDLIVNSVNYQSGSLGSYAHQYKIMEINPDTLAPWSYSEVAAAFLGFDQL